MSPTPQPIPQPKLSGVVPGFVSKPSKYSVDETVARFEALLKGKNVQMFALVNHSGEAEKAGLKMPPTKLLIFGNPAAGTPVMLAAPSIAIDLPLKVLVWQDAAGAVWISFNDPAYLQARHNVPADLAKNIGVVAALIDHSLV
ncbi:MAG TPA: DUF302 domain-containing protein [Candidatus Acidoferrales bacterium]|jgi:uncharacterized protein (DUF302 family)|nr:DUF302 domain-containing protein [Candidatus Acidoferrales bacterium]